MAMSLWGWVATVSLDGPSPSDCTARDVTVSEEIRDVIAQSIAPSSAGSTVNLLITLRRNTNYRK